jgi:hypothetical protein
VSRGLTQTLGVPWETGTKAHVPLKGPRPKRRQLCHGDVTLSTLCLAEIRLASSTMSRALEANWWREHYLFLFCWYWEDDSILQSEMWVYSLAHAPFGKAHSKCKIDRPKRLACENTLDLMGPCGPKTMCMNLRCKRGNFTMLIRFRSLGSSGVTQPCSIGRRCDIMD